MKLCTFPNCAYLSETSRMIEIYKVLKSRHIDVIMATHGGPYEKLFAQEGIEYYVVPPHFSDERARQYVKSNTGEDGIQDFYSSSELKEHVQNEIEFFEKNGVDRVLSGFTLSCSISTRALNIPYFVTHLGSFVPPVFEKNMLVPTLVTNSKLFQIIPQSWLKKLVNVLMYKSKFGTKVFNEVAESFGVEKFHSMTEVMIGDVVVVTDLPEILGISKVDIEGWKPAGKYKKYYNKSYQLRYGGAIYAKLFGDVPKELLGFIDTDKPKIYIALTSGSAQVLERVYEGIKNIDAKIVIVTTLHNVNMSSHDNILIVDHLPSHKVMPHMDLAIIHGGQGSVQTAIAGATPLLGIPLHVEQGLNVSIVERHHAGKLLSKHNIDPSVVENMVLEILGDEKYKTNMAKLCKIQNGVDGVEKAADIIVNEAF